MADEESVPIYKVKFDSEGDKFAVTTESENQLQDDEPNLRDNQVNQFLDGNEDDEDDFIGQTEFNFGNTRKEEDAINAKEAELMLKARQLENEMLEIRQAKVNQVLR